MGAKIPPGKTGALRRAELEAKPPPILVVALAALAGAAAQGRLAGKAGTLAFAWRHRARCATRARSRSP